MADLTMIVEIGSNSIKFGSANDEEPTVASSLILPANFQHKGTESEELKTLLVTHLEKYQPTKIFYIVPQGASRNFCEALLVTSFESLKARAVGIARCTDVIKARQGHELESGIIVDVGHSQTSCLSYFDGFSVARSSRFDLGGKDITSYLLSLLSKNNSGLVDQSHTEEVAKIKEELCHFGLPNFEAAFQLLSPDLQEIRQIGFSNITVFKEKILAPEILFKPNLIGKDFGGIQSLVHSVIQKADISVRSEMVKNIRLVGGSSQIPGFAKRLEWELKFIDPEIYSECQIQVGVGDPHGAWSLAKANFTNSQLFPLVTVASYEKNGPRILRNLLFSEPGY